MQKATMVQRKLETALGRARGLVRGWRTGQKLVVLESDDWGSIRTSSREAYDRIRAAGYALQRSAYGLDALENDTDLQMLYDVLGSVRDARGRPACMTANMILANPDFAAIKQSGFRKYFFEPAAETLARCPGGTNVAALWQEGLARKVFVPQLHAREHICWWQWLKALQDGSPEAAETFGLGMCGVPRSVSKENRGFFDPPYVSDEDLRAGGVDLERMVGDGARLFAKQFGYRPLSVIAPKYCWTDRVEGIWRDSGLRYVQGMLFQRVGSPKSRRPHYLGERSPSGMLYLVRNCTFEPATGGAGWADACLRDVARAFVLRRPAIICTHRVNFIGSVSAENRSRGLEQLASLLGTIRRRWRDVLFLSTPELGFMIEHGMGDARELCLDAVTRKRTDSVSRPAPV